MSNFAYTYLLRHMKIVKQKGLEAPENLTMPKVIKSQISEFTAQHAFGFLFSKAFHC